MIQKMINFDDINKQNMKVHCPNWQQILDHSYILLLLIGGDSGWKNPPNN